MQMEGGGARERCIYIYIYVYIYIASQSQATNRAISFHVHNDRVLCSSKKLCLTCTFLPEACNILAARRIWRLMLSEVG